MGVGGVGRCAGITQRVSGQGVWVWVWVAVAAGWPRVEVHGVAG